jgi:methionyl-tRNA formyltransferase
VTAPRKILCVGKRADPLLQRVRYFLEINADVETLEGARGEPLPERLLAWRGDVLISYLSPWVIPSEALKHASEAAINFHPGPPEYPGIGCTNFALYEGASRYGVTCHHMERVPDTGRLIGVRRFAVLATDTVLSLTQRAHAHQLALFYDVMERYFRDGTLPSLEERWTRRPFLRRELDALGEIRPEMSPGEVARRVRAVTYPGMPGAYLWVDGRRVEWKPPA